MRERYEDYMKRRLREEDERQKFIYESPDRGKTVRSRPITKHIKYKYDEPQLLNDFKNYIDATYKEHYSQDRFQATEFIMDGGHGTGFCIGNVLKYAQRYGKKGSRDDARKDLMKVLHYALLQLYVHDRES